MIPLLIAVSVLTAPASNSSGYYTDQEAQALFQQGNEAFARDDYPQAREDFEKLLAHGFGGADVHYNLGTVALAQGDLGRAVLNLERARREGGSSEDVEANLALARSKQLDKVVGAQGDGSVASTVAEQTPTSWIGVLFLGTWSAAFLLLIARRLLVSTRTRQVLGLFAFAGFAAAAASGAFLAFQAYVRTDQVEAVVLDKSVPARELPDASSKVAFEVHAGLEVQVGDQDGGYVRIQLPNGLVGWAPKSAVERI